MNRSIITLTDAAYEKELFINCLDRLILSVC